MKRIDLNDARTSREAKVFSGRSRGKYWRERFRLDELDTSDTPVTVVIPGDIFSINLSFFLSLFGQSVRTLGKERFLQKYRFECDPDLKQMIEQGVDQALKRSSALPEIA